MNTQSKQTLKSKLLETEQENSRLFLALNDAIDGKVTWFGRANCKIGICRENAPSGPIAIIKTDCYANAYMWDQWFPKIHDDCGSSNDEAYQKLRNLAYEANAYIHRSREQQAA